jgi:hypothetical protein
MVTRWSVAAWSKQLTNAAPARPSGRRSSKNGSVLDAMATESAGPIR